MKPSTYKPHPHLTPQKVHRRALAALAFAALVACDPGDDQRVTTGNRFTLPPGSLRVVALNRHGGAYRYDRVDDARSNLASALDVPGPVTQPPFGGTDADWDALVTCVQRALSPYHVTVTDQPDPGEVYMEVSVGGTRRDLGFERPIQGIGARRSDCGPLERGVAFVFSAALGEDDVPTLCWVTVHELGHLMGLDHSLACDETMSYLSGCGEKSFTDQDLMCGEGEERPCPCGQTQNSDAHLRAVLGPSRR
jgi:hypothetical protein